MPKVKPLYPFSLKEELIPEWAKEKLEELNATAEEETEGMTMGGM